MSETAEYIKSCESEFWQAVFRKEIEYILQALHGYWKVLSVGCGPAIIERELQKNGFVITGLDTSEEALSVVPESIKTVVGSAEKMEFPDASFDAVLYVASLQFIDNYEKALQESARVLIPDGRLLVMLLNPASAFFKSKRRQANSYINNIKHTDLAKIEGGIRRFFVVERVEYYLGIRDGQIFDTRDPALAALYIVQGAKR